MDDSSYDVNALPELLNQYYKRLFPYRYYYKWLSYGNVSKSYFANREFSFTLKDDIYVRYQSFADQAELEKEIQKRQPYKIDIGAVYSHKPKDHKTIRAGAFIPEEKELVFDIDMTDYDEIRNCCSGASICKRCWPLMTVAIKVIDRALRDDFGFNHRLWVYSGRRGVHCWVCDESARKLSQTARSAIAEYLSVIKGGENQVRKVILPKRVHPSIRKARGFAKKFFEDQFLNDQGLLDSPEHWKSVLALVPDNIKDTMNQKWTSENTAGINRWKELCSALGEKNVTEIILQFVYPRLDVNVSKGLNHLLKSPFCIHPKTGRVCIPIDLAKVDDFNPFTVPTISKLCAEIDDYDKKHSTSSEMEEGVKQIKDFEKTSLLDSVEIFKKFLEGLDKENNRIRREHKEENGVNSVEVDFRLRKGSEDEIQERCINVVTGKTGQGFSVNVVPCNRNIYSTQPLD